MDELSQNIVYYAWFVAGILGAAAYGWGGYRLMRRLLGYRKFRGSWYNDRQYRQLLQLIYDDSRRGVAMRDDEVRALRAWLEDDANLPGLLRPRPPAETVPARSGHRQGCRNAAVGRKATSAGRA